MDGDDDFIQRTERIYIDPQELIALKKKRKSFKMVKSIYEPSQQDCQLIDNNQFDKTTKCSSINQIHKKNLSSPKLLSHRYSHIDNLLPYQKIQSLHQILQNQIVSPNVQFIWKLFPSSIKKHIINYQQGDCIPFLQSKAKQNDKYLILSGQVKIVGKNNNSFKRKPGYLFFLSKVTKEKIKEIIVIRSTKILKIPQKIYQGIIKPYLRLKYSQRLNFVHICPFFIWDDKLSQDLAGCMQLILSEKQEVTYESNQYGDKIYFVKQGIVLLERNTTLRNSLIEGYEGHYQKNEISQKDVILVVRKGMVFGVDGVLIKQFGKQSQPIRQVQTLKLLKNEDQNNDQIAINKSQQGLQFNKNTSTPQRSNQRIYTARTLGKCQLYCLDKKVLQTLFTMNDITQDFLINKQKISYQQLQRLSFQYTNMLVTNKNIGINQIPLKRKQIVLNVQNKLQQRNHSLTSIQQKSSFLVKNTKKSINSPSKKFIHKRIFSQNQQQLLNIQQLQDNQKFNIDQGKQINQIRNKIKSYRQKLKISFIKKSTLQKQFYQNNQIHSINQRNLPKILQKNQTKSISKFKNNSFQKSIKLDTIIRKKLKQDLHFYSKQSPKLQKIQSSQVQNDKKIKKSQVVKLLEQQNIRYKSIPSLINLKSYKSMGSVISTVLKT